MNCGIVITEPRSSDLSSLIPYLLPLTAGGSLRPHSLHSIWWVGGERGAFCLAGSEEVREKCSIVTVPLYIE
jgi:hypothetical protein